MVEMVWSVGMAGFGPNRHGAHALQRFPNTFDAGALYGDETAVTDKGRGKGWSSSNAATSSGDEGSGSRGWGHHWSSTSSRTPWSRA